MGNQIEVLWASILTVLALFMFIIIGPLLGAFSGLVVGIFFSAPILHVLREVGIDGISMWQLGALLGFVGGFFRTITTKGENK